MGQCVGRRPRGRAPGAACSRWRAVPCASCTLVPSSAAPSSRYLRNAPREIRTPTVQTDHKALNLAQDLPDPSERRRNAHLLHAAGRSGRGGRSVCCHGVVTETGRSAGAAFMRPVPDSHNALDRDPLSHRRNRARDVTPLSQRERQTAPERREPRRPRQLALVRPSSTQRRGAVEQVQEIVTHHPCKQMRARSSPE